MRYVQYEYRYSVRTSCLGLFVCIVFFLPCPSFAQSTDEIDLRRMIEKFFASYQKENLDEVLSLCVVNSPDHEAMRQQFQKAFAASENIQIRNLKILKIDLEADKAAVRVIMEVSAIDSATGKPASGLGWMDRTLRCVKTADGWKLYSYATTADEFAPKLAGAETHDERRKLISDEQMMMTAELGQALIREGERHYSQGRYRVALKAFDLALGVARETGSKAIESLALIRRAIIRYLEGNYDLSLKDSEEALRIAEELDDHALISKVMNILGLVLRQQGNYRKAMQCYRRGLAICQDAGDKHGAAAAFGNMGMIFEAEGNYSEALGYLKKALQLDEESGDKAGLISILVNIGNVLQTQGDFTEALDYYARGLKLFEETGQKALMATTLLNIGGVLWAQGNNFEAMRHYQKALKLAAEVGEQHSLPTILYNIGLLHEGQGNHAQGIEYYERALKVAEESGDKVQMPRAIERIGVIRQFQGRYSEALQRYERSLKLAEELGERGEMARTFSRIASVHQEQGDLDVALGFYEKSLKLAEELGSKRVIMEALYGIANHSYLSGRHDKAIELWNRATAIAEDSGDVDSFWRLRLFAGKAHRAANQPVEARRAFEDAIETIEAMRAQVAGRKQERQQFFESRIDPYHLMVDLLIAQKAYAEAFAYAERAKGRTLLDAMQSDVAKRATAMTAEEKEGERKLISHMVSLNAQIYRQKANPQPDESILKELNAYLDKARLEYEAYMTGLFVTHPELKIRRGEMKPLRLEEAGRLIENATTAYLEFVVTENRTHLFVLTKKESHRSATSSSPDLKVYTIDIGQKEMARRAALFRARVANKDVGIHDLARELYDLLLRPAQAQLKNKTALVIVPDDSLWELPFQALKPASDRYLLEERAISYAPSFTVLGEMRKPRNRAPAAAMTLLAFGNPFIGEETAQRVASVFMSEKLLPLPESERQVKALRAIYGPERSRIYIGSDAREDRAKLEAGSCRILHIATHGIVNDSSPLYSHLVLARPEGDSGEDGLLEAWEIMNLDLKADLAVLSACDTARGRVAAGEGMIGLAWALFIAGCPTTVVSQWRVEAASTTELMVEFHRNLSRRPRARSPLAKAEALRRASLRLLRSRFYRHPFYWASFVMIGNHR